MESTFGYRAGGSIQTGNKNTAFGVGALSEANVAGFNNTALGTRSLWNTTGNNNVGVGIRRGHQRDRRKRQYFHRQQWANPETRPPFASERTAPKWGVSPACARRYHRRCRYSGDVDTVGQLGTVSPLAPRENSIEDIGDTSALLARNCARSAFAITRK